VLDVDHPLAWNVVQELGHVLTSWRTLARCGSFRPDRQLPS
jgi:hypothetical protein